MSKFLPAARVSSAPASSGPARGSSGPAAAATTRAKLSAPNARRAFASALLVTAAAAALGAAPASAAPSKKCSKHTTEVARNNGSVLWTDGSKLWSCTVYGGRKPQNRQIGPWTKQSQVILGGAMVGWTQRTKVSGKTADLVFAADLSRYAANPRFLTAAKPAFGPGTGSDLRVSALQAGGSAVAWVTTGGRLLATFAGNVSDPKALGSGTAGAADTGPDGMPAGGAGLLEHPTVSGGRAYIGQWAGITPAALADTITITNAGGEGDECGTVDEYRIEVQPLETAPKLGASFWVSSTNDGPAC
ncbi:MAG: hypothetical protein PGN13_03220 [Patulibacter minatonensis]